MSEWNGLPGGWVTSKLEDVADIVMGQSPPSSAYNEEGQGMPFFQGKAEFTDLIPVVRKWCSAPAKVAEAGDVLLSVRAPVGPTNLAPSRCCIGRGLAAIHALDGVEPRYILYAIRAFAPDLSNLATGTTFEAVTGNVVRTFEIPVAPSVEQRLIVAAIEEQFSRLDAGVLSLERARANLKRYRTAVLKAAVEGRLTEGWREENPDVEPASELLERILKERCERWEKDQLAVYEKKGKKPPKNWRSKYKEPVGPDEEDLPELPERWCWARIEASSQLVTSGSRGWAKYYSDDGAAFIRMGNLDHETVTLDLSHIQRVNPPAGAEGTRTRVQPNDILVSITAELGMIALAPGDLDEAYINQHVALARPVEGSTGKYLAWYLASRNGNRQLQSLRRGATKTGLGLDDIRAVRVALPPLEEQEQIVREVERRLSILQEVEAEVEANLKRAARLRQSILKRALEGRLVPQNPSDEPASELLERIRRERAAEKKPGRKKADGKRRRGVTAASQPPTRDQPGLFD